MPAPQEPQQQAPMEMSSTSAPGVVSQQPAAEPQPDKEACDACDAKLGRGKDQDETKNDKNDKGKAKTVTTGDSDNHADQEDRGPWHPITGKYQYYMQPSPIIEEDEEE
ncbi:hypothetical protein F5Y03DRAFT_7591 [Xylaria venustula]|nr:hypothetical protein F5Y03DRAFT_7591 [Xylaria venustula]